jgi:peroxiredoxin
MIMKKMMFVFMLLAPLFSMAESKMGKLEIGDKAVKTDVKMVCVSGEQVSLDDVAQDNGLLVLFSCNSCPFVLRWEDRFPELKDWADKNDVGMVVLNSNYQKRSGDDSLEAMKKHASEKGYNFHYVVDKESQIANSFGGQTTPHAFLFDGDMKLVYKGLIDDNHESADDVKQAYLKDAISSLGRGQMPQVAETKPMGCSIKRKVD